MQQINNVLYEKKHRYMLILKQINILYNQANDEVLNNEIPAFKAKQIKDMYNQTLIGLIEEGVEYQYIKNSSDSSKDIISITIDGLNYRCKNTDIKDILDNRYEDVMGISYTGPKRKKVEKNESDYKIPDIPEKTENFDIQYFIPPKVYISTDNDFSEKKPHNFFRTIKQVITTIIALAIAFFIFMYFWGKDNVRTNVQKGISNISSTLNINSEETTTSLQDIISEQPEE